MFLDIQVLYDYFSDTFYSAYAALSTSLNSEKMTASSDSNIIPFKSFKDGNLKPWNDKLSSHRLSSQDT